jgi:hypothetical protein
MNSGQSPGAGGQTAEYQPKLIIGVDRLERPDKLKLNST